MKIASLGYYLPSNVVTIDDLIARLGNNENLNLEKIKKRLVINKALERRFKSPEETGIEMAHKAITNCLSKINFPPEEIDLILYVAMLREYEEPAMSIVLQDKIKAKNANAFDVSNACNGFLNAMEIAYDRIILGKCRNILIVGAEANSNLIPWHKFNEEDFSGFSALTIADGAAAMLLQRSNENDFDFEFHTFGEFHDLSIIKIGKEINDLKLIVEPRAMAEAAQKITGEFIPRYLNEAIKNLDGIDHIFLHQITGDPRRYCGNLPDEIYGKTYVSFDPVGNTGSISIPLGMALAEEEGKLKRGDHIVAIVGAAGLSIGAVAFIY